MRPRPPLRSVALGSLRRAKGFTDAELSKETGISVRMLSHYQTIQEPAPEVMESCLTAMEYEATAEEAVVRGLERACRGNAPVLTPVDPTPAERRKLARVSFQAGLAMADLLEARVVRFIQGRRAHRARLRAGKLWETLEGLAPARRRLLVEKAWQYQTWALAERLAHESEKAASHQVPLALELAELAVRVAELAPGEEGWRSRLKGYALAFVANAWRVQGELGIAENLFVQARKLWEAGASADPGLLARWRLPDLEASLRRGQRRFKEALDLHEEALALGPEAAGRILLKKVATLEQMEDAEGALKALDETARRVEAEGDLNLLFALRFNRVAVLCDLERYREASSLLPEVRGLAVELRKELHLVRLLWLRGRIAAGLRQIEEAVRMLEQVRADFASHGMAYDEALAGVKLALLHLEQGDTEKVKTLARAMEPIFRARAIHREALAALTLFCQAVEQERATAELARRLFDYLRRARYDPALPFEP